MANVPDDFLLEVAGIGASLLGFFVIGVFFYVQRGMFPQAAPQARTYMRASTGAIVVLYGMTVMLSLGLVVLSGTGARLLYVGLSLVLIWSVARTSLSIRDLHRALGMKVMWQTGMWLAAASIVALPWILGGTQPSRADLTWGLLLTGLFAFISSASLILSTFDISTLEERVKGGEERRTRSAKDAA